MSHDELKRCLENPRFRDFVMREFERTVLHTPVEELAEFAFGSVNAAVEAFVSVDSRR